MEAEEETVEEPLGAVDEGLVPLPDAVVLPFPSHVMKGQEELLSIDCEEYSEGVVTLRRSKSIISPQTGAGDQDDSPKKVLSPSVGPPFSNRRVCSPSPRLPAKNFRPNNFSHSLAYPPPHPDRSLRAACGTESMEMVYGPWSLTWSPYR